MDPFPPILFSDPSKVLEMENKISTLLTDVIKPVLLTIGMALLITSTFILYWPSIMTHRQGWQRSDKVLSPVTSEWQSRVRSESVIKVTDFYACTLMMIQTLIINHLIFAHAQFIPIYHLSHIGGNTVFLCYSSLSPLSMPCRWVVIEDQYTNLQLNVGFTFYFIFFIWIR